ncbi:glycerol-3-phosphate acyltransferase 1 [Virgibacillus phasianinus]|uniref:Glycerol-3-phosphate acyltransferase n=1 Tax=Virgibacillus phasianinus TaxID=2017483 RepID=A0A220U0F0_9BACI|nr:glycerol-3-phosphate acyltransferase [Virgibacillus phasianinus]ASK61403.1 glycerol-3-phosphate acyltransferase 1 [Virgibacillus phasianinus]
MVYILSVVIGYLFGCVHGSQIVGKYKKVDIKKTGVKNSGASNTTILLGFKYGIIVAFIDIFKATLSILFLLYIIQGHGLAKEETVILVYLTTLFVVIGHNYPVTMNFRGGKGTASLVGAFLAIDWKVAVICIGTLLVLSLVTDYLVVGVFLMYIAFIVTSLYFFGAVTGGIAFLLFLISLIMHWENYRRIFAKDETRISSVFRKKTA